MLSKRTHFRECLILLILLLLDNYILLREAKRMKETVSSAALLKAIDFSKSKNIAGNMY